MKTLTITIVALFLCVNTAHAELTSEEQYLKNYAEQLKPILKEQLSLETSIENEQNAQDQIAFLADKIAKCQLNAIDNYPQKYKDALINPIIEGEEILQVTKDVNTLMQADIDSGELPEKQFTDMIQETTEKYKACLN